MSLPCEQHPQHHACLYASVLLVQLQLLAQQALKTPLLAVQPVLPSHGRSAAAQVTLGGISVGLIVPARR